MARPDTSPKFFCSSVHGLKGHKLSHPTVRTAVFVCRRLPGKWNFCVKDHGGRSLFARPTWSTFVCLQSGLLWRWAGVCRVKSIPRRKRWLPCQRRLVHIDPEQSVVQLRGRFRGRRTQLRAAPLGSEGSSRGAGGISNPVYEDEPEPDSATSADAAEVEVPEANRPPEDPLRSGSGLLQIVETCDERV
ncbi:uncharacterized protein LOC133472199 isoform X2 [Phyllopteryx taeniolatus]|uniref:uncharacterized protein LOC133472199 isoform X2 n=1 Tax=Phyllopteryx taeniolatus TaxID=161469 RepID=UPI002AD564B6|nr:uncharacterized protein LOC133472199 isoform X2 [Phyllopteryx taeniolatus]